jgi:3'-phosphoadenosine 5'-phosphosulfate sulfotransferase (PAPS reductase)/FAD synthetase
MLGFKQSENNSNFIQTFRDIQNIVSKEVLDMAIQETLRDFKQLKHKKVGLAWSGGKDSVVVEFLLNQSNINYTTCIGMTPELEYPEFMEYVTNNMPKDLNVYMSKHTFEWLSNNQKYLFPKDSNVASVWFKNVQHRAQDLFFKEKNLEILITGRRKKDRNFVGKNNMYINKRTKTFRFSPIADWSHEMVLACIYYYNLPLAPFYNWYNGWVVGSCNIANRQWTGSVEKGWEEVWNIDKNMVLKASKYIKSAESYVRNMGF